MKRGCRRATQAVVSSNHPPHRRPPPAQNTYATSCKLARASVEAMLATGLDAALREVEERALAQIASLQSDFEKEVGRQ